MLDRNAVRWIVVESRDLVGLKEFELLHQALQGSGYRLVDELPVSSNVPEFADLSVRIYENLDLPLLPDGRARIDYPYFGGEASLSASPTRRAVSPRPNPAVDRGECIEKRRDRSHGS